MKPTFCRLLVLSLSVLLGLAASICLADQSVSDTLIPPVTNLTSVETGHHPRADRLVISVPADGEFYLGKKQVELPQIIAFLTFWVRSIPRGERVLYVKSANTVKFETLALVIKEAKVAGVDRIEFVLDKKKLPA